MSAIEKKDGRYDDPSNAKYFRNLKDFIATGYRLYLFTLNYDDCVEQALAHELNVINSKWTNGFDDKDWKPASDGRGLRERCGRSCAGSRPSEH